MQRSIILSFFVLLSLVPGPLRAGQTKADWLAPTWRSAIAPGWGQAYNQQPTKAWCLGGLTWGLFGGVVLTYVQGSQALQAYDDAKTPAEATARFDDADRWALTNQILYVCFAASYTYTLVDAGLNAQRKPVKLGLSVSPQGPRLRADLSF